MMFPGQKVKEKVNGMQFPMDISTTLVTLNQEREKAQETFII